MPKVVVIGRRKIFGTKYRNAEEWIALPPFKTASAYPFGAQSDSFSKQIQKKYVNL